MAVAVMRAGTGESYSRSTLTAAGSRSGSASAGRFLPLRLRSQNHGATAIESVADRGLLRRPTNRAASSPPKSDSPPKQRKGFIMEHFCETVNLVGSRVDRASSSVRGVKVLGRMSRNGREYTLDAIRKAASLYEGAKVNVNHRERGQRREYGERIGVLRNVEFRDNALYADLRFNPKHALAEQLAWDAENAPGNLGLSHDAEGRVVRRDGKTIVEEIRSVRSVDLVADPATSFGLFEDLVEDGAVGAFPGGESFVRSVREGYSPTRNRFSDFAKKLRQR